MKLSDLQLNIGQLEGLPANPRYIEAEDFEQLKLRLLRMPQYLRHNPIKVEENNIILGGNMRYRALQALAEEHAVGRWTDKNGVEHTHNFTNEIPDEWVVQLTDYTLEDKRRIVLLDNAQNGKDDLERLAAEWSEAEINDWGNGLPEEWNIDDIIAEEDKEEKEINPIAEELIKQAWHEYVGEFADQFDLLYGHGYAIQGKTPAYAKIQFLKTKYYGKRYERSNSLVFTPHQFKTSANICSYYDQLLKSRTGEAGIAGFRHITDDGNLVKLFSTSYPISGARMPLDFPVEVARELIAEYANKGRVLDPCHGWGARLVAALLEEVKEYVGVDPSPYAHKGVGKIYETYKAYQETGCKLIEKPYEKTDEQDIDGLFDFALTSPPYFDVEQYDGEETSTKLYDNFRLWVDMFYEPLIVNTVNRLKPGCFFALQVGSQTYDLKGEMEKICKKHNLKVVNGSKNILQNGLHVTEEERSECIFLIQKKHK